MDKYELGLYVSFHSTRKILQIKKRKKQKDKFNFLYKLPGIRKEGEEDGKLGEIQKLRA